MEASVIPSQSGPGAGDEVDLGSAGESGEPGLRAPRSVESRSKDFAMEYANTLIDVYLRFRDEQRQQHSERVLLALTREVNRLYQELKSANKRLAEYVKEHNSASVSEEQRSMRNDVDRLRSLYDSLMEELIMTDSSAAFESRYITILDAASVDANPTMSFFGRD